MDGFAWNFAPGVASPTWSTVPNFISIRLGVSILWGSNFGLSHRNEMSPLTHGLNYRSACDIWWLCRSLVLKACCWVCTSLVWPTGVMQHHFNEPLDARCCTVRVSWSAGGWQRPAASRQVRARSHWAPLINDRPTAGTCILPRSYTRGPASVSPTRLYDTTFAAVRRRCHEKQTYFDETQEEVDDWEVSLRQLTDDDDFSSSDDYVLGVNHNLMFRNIKKL